VSTSFNSYVPSISHGLCEDEYGIWHAKSTNTISYPHAGNDECFQLEDTSYWFQHRNACILSVIKRFHSTGVILDIGGGNGFVTRALLDAGFQAILLEPGPAGAMNAKRSRGIESVICADLESARLKTASVDAVGLFDVLEHIREDQEFIQELHRIIKPGGRLYMTVPAFESLWSRADIEAGHFRRYTLKRVRNDLKAKFHVDWSTYFFAALTLPIFLLRSLPYRMGLARSGNIISPKGEHGTSGGVMVQMIKALLAREYARLSQGRTAITGSSCLVVARRC